LQSDAQRVEGDVMPIRETLQQVAKKMLTDPPGTEKVVEINVNDGLTGFPPGMSARGVRMKNTTMKVKEAKRADGKKRHVVVAMPKETVLATGEWE
jgi:hypothetical protein